jgi:hypothetical protein
MPALWLSLPLALIASRQINAGGAKKSTDNVETREKRPVCILLVGSREKN